jgi:RNA polymerase-binding transcription factor DksA
LAIRNADAEADLHIRLHENDAHLLRAIEEALARIAQDRFGVCEMCGSPISKARLEAVDACVPRLQGARAVSGLRRILEDSVTLT